MKKASLIEKWKGRDSKGKKEFQRKVKRLNQKHNKSLVEDAAAVHVQVFKEIDCLDCANCCTSIPPIVQRSDARRIAKHLGLKPNEFEDKYLRVDEDGDKVMKTSPCVFLGAGNKCEIYEVRPKACRQYPHTDGHEFKENLHLHAQNAQYCPAVFHVVERLSTIGQ